MASPRAVEIYARFLLTIVGALAVAACGANSPTDTIPKALGLSGPPNLTSFLGVRFGDSIYRVQNHLKSGTVETGLYGADVYRINNIEVDSIRYKQVKYEFTTSSGMQLVMAWFTPDSEGKVLEKLVEAVGQPTQQDSTKGSAPADTVAAWQLPHGERISFNGPKRFVAVLGPGAGPLRHDATENESLDPP